MSGDVLNFDCSGLTAGPPPVPSGAERWMSVRVDRLSAGDLIINPGNGAGERVVTIEVNGPLTELRHTGSAEMLLPSAARRFQRRVEPSDPLAVMTTGGRVFHSGEALALDGDGAGTALCGTYGYETDPSREVTCKRCRRSTSWRSDVTGLTWTPTGR